MITALLWDAGGTLFDTYPAAVRAFQLALAGLGVSAPEAQIMALARKSLEHCALTLAAELGVDPAAVQRGFYAHYATIPEGYQTPFPGVIEVCAYIQSIGGQNFIITHRSRASLEGLLETHGMQGYFSDSIAKEDPYPRKPDPAALLALMARRRLAPAATLAIGDRELDIAAGRAAGVRTCFFGAEIIAGPVDFQITDFYTLLAWLQAENSAG